MRRFALYCSILFIAASPLWPQDEPFTLLGVRLGDLIGRLGPPEAAYAVRGTEEWQDDVVLVYSAGDFYIAKDRVWQIALKSVYGVKIGDPKPAALLVLGEETQDRGDHALLPLPGGGWPRMLQVNFDGAGMVSAIFIYRADF
jgi:hypothetical protein